MTKGFATISDLVESEKSLHVGTLIRFYKKYEDSPVKAKEELKRLIAMKYVRKERFKNAFGESYGTEDELYITNKNIEEFLMENPISDCVNYPKNSLLKCNLDNFLPTE